MTDDSKKRYIGDVICKIIISILLIIAFLPLLSPVLFAIVTEIYDDLSTRIDKSITLTDETGDKFKVEINGRGEFPPFQAVEYNYTISVKYKKAVLYSFESDQAKEVVLEYLEKPIIEKEYHDGDIHAYKFDFAIIYSLDNKRTFYSVSDKDYLYFSKRDSEFKKIYDLLYQTG